MMRPDLARFGAAGLGLAVAGCSDIASDCRREVETAYQRLEALGQSYRAETMSVINGQQIKASAFEFVPPDRRRMVAIDGQGKTRFTDIQVGKQVWTRYGESGWHEIPAGQSTLFKRSPVEAMVACLGPVDFSGKTYTGYRTRYDPKAGVTVTFLTFEVPKAEPQGGPQAQPKVREQPQLWRTVLVDRDTGLLAHEIIAPEDQLDKPHLHTSYTFPNDIRIEAPAK